jgi:hypothetical protein
VLAPGAATDPWLTEHWRAAEIIPTKVYERHGHFTDTLLFCSQPGGSQGLVQGAAVASI